MLHIKFFICETKLSIFQIKFFVFLIGSTFLIVRQIKVTLKVLIQVTHGGNSIFDEG